MTVPKTVAVVVLTVLVAGAWLQPAAADEPGESEESAQLVRQAIALLVNTPSDMAGIEDKIVDAQEAPDQEGVDLDLVADAEAAFERGDMHEVRALLERSIGAQPHLGEDDPLPIGDTRAAPGMATGAETGIDVVSDPLDPDRSRSGGDWLAVGALVVLAGAGAWLAARYRPRTHAQEARS